MRKFSNRFKADWNNGEILEELLEEFFEDEELLKTKASLCFFLNVSIIEFDRRKRLPEFEALLGQAELLIQMNLESAGMVNDKSFAKFLLETQYGYTKEVKQTSDTPKLHIEVSIED